MKKILLTLSAFALLTGCTSVNTLNPDFYTARNLGGAKQDLKIGVLVRNPSNFEATAHTTASKCVLNTSNVYSAFIGELRTIFKEAQAYETIADCSDCDAFAIYDSTLEFGMLHGCRIHMSAEFVDKNKNTITTVALKKQAGFSQTHGAAIGLGALTGASLGLLTPITAPVGSKIACNRMQERAQEVYAEVIAEMGDKIRNEAALRKGDKTILKQNTVKSSNDKYAQLTQLKEFLDQGILTKKEFDIEKRKILNQ